MCSTCGNVMRMNALANKQIAPVDAAAAIEKALSGAIPGVSPGGLLEAMEDPAVIERQCRALAYVQIATISKMSSSPAFTMTNRLKFLELLAKLGKLVGADVSVNLADRAPNISIVFEGDDDLVRGAAAKTALKVVRDVPNATHLIELRSLADDTVQ